MKEQTRWFLLLGVLLADQISKLVIRAVIDSGERLTLIPRVLWLSHVQNTGASFGSLQGQNALLIWISLIVLGLLIYWYDAFPSWQERTAHALIIAGLLGNLIDRVVFGHVTDFLDLGWWPVFNIADSALVVGVVGLILYEAFWKKRTK